MWLGCRRDKCFRRLLVEDADKWSLQKGEAQKAHEEYQWECDRIDDEHREGKVCGEVDHDPADELDKDDMRKVDGI